VIKFRNERVRSFSRSYNDFYWEIVPTSEDLDDYDFYVERSEAEMGPWHEIAGPFIDRYYFRDPSPPKISAVRTLFYRVRAVHRLSGKEIYSDRVDPYGKEPLDAQEMIRLEEMLYREFVGVRCWLFARRSFGQRCPQCYDEVMGKRMEESCPVCFGTTFSGGYHYPVEFFAQIDPVEMNEQVTEYFHHQPQQILLRTGPVPEIRPMDLIVDSFNRRFKALSVGGTARLQLPVRQDVRCALVQAGSIEDAVPVQVDTEALQPTASRLYTNPQNVEQVGAMDEEELSRLLGTYGF
jgi:hypothetical protein